MGRFRDYFPVLQWNHAASKIAGTQNKSAGFSKYKYHSETNSDIFIIKRKSYKLYHMKIVSCMVILIFTVEYAGWLALV